MTKVPSEFEALAQEFKEKLIQLSGNENASFELSALLTTGIK